MKKKLTLLKTFLLFGCMGSFTLMASEIDSFTHRYSDLPDSTQKLNAITNLKLIKAINEANKKGACNETYLYDEIQTEFVGPFGVFFFTNIETYIEENPHIEKLSVKRQNSIYQEFNFFDSPPIHLANLGSVLKLNQSFVGTDKIGHFFALGYYYFYQSNIKQQGYLKALMAGEEQEGGLLGFKATGIWSYADLVANYHGLIFWTKLLEKYSYPPLPITNTNDGPYVVCEGNRWVLNQSFNWEDYVDEGWDEAINCNKFANDKLAELALTRIKKLEDAYRKPLACPLSQRSCFNLVEKYQDLEVAKRILHPQCLSAHPGSFDFP